LPLRELTIGFGVKGRPAPTITERPNVRNLTASIGNRPFSFRPGCAISRSWRVALEQTFAAACFRTAPHNCSAERLQLSVPAIKSAFGVTEWFERLCKGGLRCVHVVRSINDAQRIEI